MNSPWTLSALVFDVDVAETGFFTSRVEAFCLSPITLSSLLFQYTDSMTPRHWKFDGNILSIVKRDQKAYRITFSFMSPFLKCSCFTLNLKPNIVCSNPSRPVFRVLYCLTYSGPACCPLMNHVNFTAGFDLPDVQFTLTLSLIWYRARPPVILGSVSGNTSNACVRKCQKQREEKKMLENSIIPLTDSEI